MEGYDSDQDRYAAEEAMLAEMAEAGGFGDDEAQREARRAVARPCGTSAPATPPRAAHELAGAAPALGSSRAAAKRAGKRALVEGPPSSSGPLARPLAFASQDSSAGSPSSKRPRRSAGPLPLAAATVTVAAADEAEEASEADEEPHRVSYLLSDPGAAPLTLPVVLPESGLYRYLEVRVGEDAAPVSRADRARAIAASRTQEREAIRVLLHCVEADRRRRARRAAMEAAERAAAAGPAGGGGSGVSGAGAEVMTEKWTDLYAPRSFPQLLSSERVNRNVLRWVKLWQGHAERAEARRERERQGRAQASARGKGSRLLGMGRGSAKGGKGKGGDAAPEAAGAAGAGGTGSGLVGVKTEVLEERERLREVFGYGWNVDARVVLLVGPAGVGKTMLAHIAGRQAGLEVMELNASDDRSASRLQGRLAAAMQMRSLTASGRGRLVILDEVDGLDTGAVDLLVRMITATPPVVPTAFPWRGPASGGSGRRRRGASAAPALTCPVICTCNELYAPSLRKLREHCQVIEMRRPSQERLSGLLRTICREQGMTPTQEGVAALSERCGYDIRACINTLQTVPKRHGEAARAGAPFRLTPELVRGLPVGSKDDARSAFDVWASVFSGHQGRRSAGRMRRGAAPTGDVAEAAAAYAAVAAAAAAVRRREAGGAVSAAERAAAVARGEEDEDDEALELPSTSLNVAAIVAAIRSGAAEGSARPGGASGTSGAAAALGSWPRTGPQSFTRFLLEDLSSRGVDVQLLLDGLHENFPSSPHTDPGMEDAARAADWLSVGELFTNGARRTQSYGLNRMAAVCGAGVHWCAASDRPGHRLRPRWPAQRRRMRTEQQERQEVLRSFIGGRMRTGCGLGSRNERNLVLETLSPLLTLAAPPLRERNTGLLNSRERRDMADAVAVMATNGLVYARERPVLGGGAGEDAGRDRFSAPRLALRPPVDALVRFEGYDPYERGHRGEMAEVMKDLLSQEVRLAGVRLRAARSERSERRAARKDAERARRAAEGGGAAAGAPLVLGGAPAGTGEDAAESDDSGSEQEAGPAEVAALIQDALSGGRRRRKDLGSGADVHLPEHVRKQIHEAATGETASPSDKAKAAFASPSSKKAARAQGFLAQMRKQHTRRADNRQAPRKRFPVYFKFQEGFTDAVRRPVTLSDLIG